MRVMARGGMRGEGGRRKIHIDASDPFAKRLVRHVELICYTLASRTAFPMLRFTVFPSLGPDLTSP